MTFYFFVNLKAYKEGIFRRALKILFSMETLSIEYPDIKFGIIPNLLDSSLLSLFKENIYLLVQTVEPIEAGAKTGHIPIEIVKEIGVDGFMINHSENRVNKKTIEDCVKIGRKLGLISLVCCKDDEELKELIEFSPNFIAVEPPELIGTKKSISEEKPELIKKSYEILKDKETELIVGAGINKAEDLKIAKELGAKGVLIASSVVKSKNPLKKIEELISLI